MRYIIIFLMILNLSAKESSITIGSGIYTQSQPYKNVDALILLSPVIFYDNGILYVRWTRIGAYFLGAKYDDYAWGFSLSAEPRTNGYEADDIENMMQRKDSWEGGLSFSAKISKSYIEILAFTDILNSEKRWILKSEVGYDFKVYNISFYPSFSLTYQSSEFNNYYFGVTNDEASKKSISPYIAKSGFLWSAQTYIEYPFTSKLSTLINIKIDKLSSEATDSPIVDEKFIYSSLLSLIYTFK